MFVEDHYDPNHVENSHYTCNPHKVHTCYQGDISGKHNLFNIPTMQSFIDTQLKLSSILQRSIVIHDEHAQSSRFACQTIQKGIFTLINKMFHIYQANFNF